MKPIQILACLFAVVLPGKLLAAQTNAVASETTIDAKTGQYAQVDASREVVSLYSKDGKLVWSNNVIESVKMAAGTRTNAFPQLRGRKIQDIQVYQGELWVNLVRGYATLDIKNGEFKGISSR